MDRSNCLIKSTKNKDSTTNKEYDIKYQLSRWKLEDLFNLDIWTFKSHKINFEVENFTTDTIIIKKICYTCLRYLIIVYSHLDLK